MSFKTLGFAMTEEEAQELVDIHEKLQPLFQSRRYAEACNLIREKRSDALNRGSREQASELSGLLATCLTMDHKDEEALLAAREGVAIDPERAGAKLDLARILLYFSNEPYEARSKAEEALKVINQNHYEWYRALALVGTSRARCGDIQGAIQIFGEMTSEKMVNSLRAANYIGVFDLSVVEELVKAGAAKRECRRYLELVASVPTDWPHLRRKLEELLAATQSDA